jgi:hypothetical protein
VRKALRFFYACLATFWLPTATFTRFFTIQKILRPFRRKINKTRLESLIFTLSYSTKYTLNFIIYDKAMFTSLQADEAFFLYAGFDMHAPGRL